LARKLDEKWSEKILNATKFGSFAILKNIFGALLGSAVPAVY
jgi:hypothetical protein